MGQTFKVRSQILEMSMNYKRVRVFSEKHKKASCILNYFFGVKKRKYEI